MTSPNHLAVTRSLPYGMQHATQHAGMQNLFIPSNRTEELLLLLSLSDSIACREAVLSRSAEAEDIRTLSVHQVGSFFGGAGWGWLARACSWMLYSL